MRRLLLALGLAAALIGCGNDGDTTELTADRSVTTTAADNPSPTVSAGAPSPVASGPDVAGTIATDVVETTTSTAGTTSTASTTSTTPAATAVTPEDLAASGPFPVGVATRSLPAGNPVELWYPAVETAGDDTVGYAVRDFLPPAIAALVPDTIDDTRSIAATRDAAPAEGGPFPVVLFSHGATSFRLQSSVLAQHLASWGIVTASTDHPSRDLLNVIGGTAEGQPPAVDDFRALRTYVMALDADDPLLAGVLDTNRLALGGHSAGGATVAEVAGDEGILGYVSYASGLREAAPDVPSLFMAAADDMIVDPVERTRAAFERAPAPSWLWVFDSAGHLAFSDLCAVGTDGATLIDLAEAAGLGALVDDQLRILGTDGCEAPNRPVEEVWPGVHQAATGFYRWVFGIDATPIGLDESAVTDGVTISSK